MATYRIIGADGKEYGPVSTDQLRQWINEGRVDGATRVLVENSLQWMPLASIPGFVPPSTPAPPFSSTGYIPFRRTNSLAVTGMILGILALTLGLCCYGVPFNLLGLVFSIIGLVQINSHPELYDGKGMAISGIVLCVLSILLTAAMFLFFGLAAAFDHPPSRGTYRI